MISTSYFREDYTKDSLSLAFQQLLISLGALFMPKIVCQYLQQPFLTFLDIRLYNSINFFGQQIEVLHSIEGVLQIIK